MKLAEIFLTQLIILPRFVIYNVSLSRYFFRDAVVRNRLGSYFMRVQLSSTIKAEIGTYSSNYHFCQFRSKLIIFRSIYFICKLLEHWQIITGFIFYCICVCIVLICFLLLFDYLEVSEKKKRNNPLLTLLTLDFYYTEI